MDARALHRGRGRRPGAFGRLVLNPLFRLIGRLGERELFVVAGLFTVVGAAALMRQLHLSVALGAFVAGVVLAESPYRHELESDVEPFRSILLGLFFLSVGMLLDLGMIAARPLFVVGLAAVVIATKAILITLLSRAFGCTWTAQLPARAAAQPGRRVRLRPVRPGHGRAADHARSGFAVQRGGHPVDGRDAIPDAADRLAREARGAQRGRARRARAVARDQRDRRRLRPVWPDRRSDDAGQEHRRDPHRQEARPRSSGSANSGTRSIMATVSGSTFFAPPAPRPRR